MGRSSKAREDCGMLRLRRLGHGDWLVSGERNLRTGETPCDNFICHRCQEEARQLREVGRSVNDYWTRRKQLPRIGIERVT
jgi:hypothetical protein